MSTPERRLNIASAPGVSAVADRRVAARRARCDNPRMNPLTLATLRLMTNGDFHAGEAIAARLGVTRATVWNAIRDAQSLGLAVEKVPSRGYRVVPPPVWLDAHRVATLLGVAAARFDIEVVDAVGSTNALLLERASQGARAGTVIAAEVQTGGRGRRGRTWITNLGGALTFSVLLQFEQGAAGLSGLSLVVGIAVARALHAVGATGVGLKWPNDIQLAGRKLGGILIEVQGDALGPAAAVIGIGLNVRLGSGEREQIDQPVADLDEAGADADRNRLLAMVLTELAACAERFAIDGFAAFEAEFRRWHALQDAEVLVHLGDGSTVAGRVHGTSPEGALVLKTPAGLKRFHGGEVSLRAAAPAPADARA